MKLLDLFQSPKKDEPQPEPLELCDLVVGQIVRRVRTNEQVTITAIWPKKISFMTKKGQYSMLPDDFAREFTYVD